MNGNLGLSRNDSMIMEIQWDLPTNIKVSPNILGQEKAIVFIGCFWNNYLLFPFLVWKMLSSK